MIFANIQRKLIKLRKFRSVFVVESCLLDPPCEQKVTSNCNIVSPLSDGICTDKGLMFNALPYPVSRHESQ